MLCLLLKKKIIKENKILENIHRLVITGSVLKIQVSHPKPIILTSHYNPFSKNQPPIYH